jgi:ABC-type molybdate transport system substrate-binding protein
MVIVYTSHSKFAQEINWDNWYEILTRKEVRFGRANPDGVAACREILWITGISMLRLR